ncbi:MAG TPA: DUF6220 domain-containing protein [Streptosporangiaceae bacterium]
MTTKPETTSAGPLPATRTQPGAARRAAGAAYRYLIAFFVLGVLVQVYLAGVGVFGINARKVAKASSFDPHRAWGSVLMIVSIILLILALAAWKSVRAVLATFLLALLVVVAQTVLAAAGDSNKWVGGAHALDGMVILLLSLGLAVAAWRRAAAARSLAGHAEKNLDHRP